MVERDYQASLITKLKAMFPGCMIIKNDPQYKQGILDLTVLYEERWAMLEVKMGPKSALQANQQYYVEKLDAMSFAAIIYPQNEEEVLDALELALQPREQPCIPKS